MKRLLSDSKLAQFMDVIKDGPTDKSSILDKMQWSESALHDAVCKARYAGCEIWSINRGRNMDTLYWLKSGPDLQHAMPITPNPLNEILEILRTNAGDQFTRHELADLLGLDVMMVGHYIRKLKKKGHSIESVRNWNTVYETYVL